MSVGMSRSLIILLIGTGILILGQGLMLALVPLSMNARGFSVAAMALVGAGYFAGYFAGAWRGEQIIRRVGHIRSYGGLVALMIVAALSLPFFSDSLVWILLRFIHGFAAGGAFLAIEAWLSEGAGEKARGKVLATYMVVALGGFGASQFLASSGDVATFVPFVLGGILFAASIIPVVLTHIEVPTVESEAGTPLPEVYKRSPFSVITGFAAGTNMGAFWTLGPLFAVNMGMSVSQSSALMATAIFAGLLMQWPAGHFSDRHDRRLVATLLAGAAGIAGVITVVFVGVVGAPLAFIFFASLGVQFCLYPIAMAHGVDQATNRNESLGVARGVIMAHGLGQAIGPLLAGPFVSAMGPRGLIVYFAVILLSLAVFTKWRMRVGAQVDPSAQSKFVHARATTPVGAELNPRLDDSVSDEEREDRRDTQE